MAEDKNNFIGVNDIKTFFKDLSIILMVVIFVRFFIAMPFQISGQSMYGSYYDREFIVVDKLSYRFFMPKRGDVIVFKPNVDEQKEFFLKRIIGVGGDSIKITNGKVFLKKKGETDFIELEESYLNESNQGFTFVGNKNTGVNIFDIPDKEFFVMGDNRNHSSDSRTCFDKCGFVSHTIPKSAIVGKVFIDFGYFNLRTFSFLHPDLGIETYPRFFSSPSRYE